MSSPPPAKPRGAPKDPALTFERPLVTVDTAIFAVQAGALEVLLVRRPDDPGEPFPGLWALPGGFVDTRRDRDLESCARRKLQEKTGVVSAYLEQLGSFGNATRDPRGWSVTQVYFALLPQRPDTLTPGGNATESRWLELTTRAARLPLAFDHNALLDAVLARLRAKVWALRRDFSR